MTRFLNDVGLAYFWSKLKSYIDSNIDAAVDIINNYTVNGYEICTNPVLTKSDVGLSNLTNDAQVKRSEMGVANGVATLDPSGLIPAAQLPSYVDDVLEYASVSAFPKTGETGKIYVALDSNLTYRWSGSTYIEISKSLALGETSSTAYAGDKGAADRKALESLPSTLISGVSKGAVDGSSITINVNRITKSGLNYGSPAAVNFTLTSATTTQAGLMSSSDKNKLDNIEAGAEVNDHKVTQNAVNSSVQNTNYYSLLGAGTLNNTASETAFVNKTGFEYWPSLYKARILSTGNNEYLEMSPLSGIILAKSGQSATFKADTIGVTAVSFVKINGTSEQLLAADGSVSTPITEDEINLICV